MSLNEFKQLVLDLNRMCKNPPTLIFAGGEPLTTDITLELARFAKNKGNNLGLLTNGTLINENNAQKIADLFDVIQISIDGTTPKIHDEQRGKGSFQATTKAIGLLSAREEDFE